MTSKFLNLKREPLSDTQDAGKIPNNFDSLDVEPSLNLPHDDSEELQFETRLVKSKLDVHIKQEEDSELVNGDTEFKLYMPRKGENITQYFSVDVSLSSKDDYYVAGELIVYF